MGRTGDRERRKYITIHISGDVDVTRVLPIISHPHFEALGRRRQLGLAFLIFRDANHTRFSHSLGVYASTLQRTALWQTLHMITAEEGWNLSLYGLLHDIGHGPYSHVIEPLSSRGHKDVGLRRIEEMDDVIRRCGGDTNILAGLLSGANPLRVGVSHGPLGTDKIDYLDRDALHANITGRPPVGAILNYTYLLNRSAIAIDAKVVPEVMQLQLFYIYMYNRVYLRKLSLIAQRFFQHMMGELLAPSDGSDPELSEETLWDLTDGELDGIVALSKNPLVQQWRTMLQTRSIPRLAVSLRYNAHDEYAGGKPITAFSLPEKQLNRLLATLADPQVLRDIEQKIDAYADLPPFSTLVAPSTGASDAFRPEDITVVSGETATTLARMHPAHYAALQERSKSYPSVLVCVPEEHRRRVSDPAMAERIRDILLERVPAAMATSPSPGVNDKPFRE